MFADPAGESTDIVATVRALWLTLVAPLLDTVRPTTIVEFGDDAGLTALIEEAAAELGAGLRDGDETAPGDPPPDFALVHGQPNWHSVGERLDQLAAMVAAGDAPFPLTLVHGVDWPTGRRDEYPDPAAIPLGSRQPHRNQRGRERALDSHELRNGVMTAVEDFVARDEIELVMVHVPGLGGVAILVPPRRLEGKGSRDLSRAIAAWRLGPMALAQIAAIDAERARLAGDLDEMQAELDAARAGLTLQSTAAADTLRGRVRDLAESNAELTEELARREARLRALGGNAAESTPPAAAGLDLRARLGGAPDLGEDRSRPLPIDRRKILLGEEQPAPAHRPEPLRVTVRAVGEVDRLRLCLWSLLSRCGRPLRLTLLPDSDCGDQVRDLIESVTAAEPLIAVAASEPEDDRSEWRLRVDEPVCFSHQAIENLLAAAAEAEHPVAPVSIEALDPAPWVGPDAVALLLDGRRSADAGLAAAPCAAMRPGVAPGAAGSVALDAVVSGAGAEVEEGSRLAVEEVAALSDETDLAAALRPRLQGRLSVAYVLPGLPPEGSGGTHSIFQEVVALDSIGARVMVLVPNEFAARAKRLYPDAAALVFPFAGAESFASALEGFDLIVATEAPSARLVEEHVQGREDVVGAYYVQDYEPLFSPAGGPSADAALLSYRRAENLLLFAKTDWVANVVGAAHDVAVAKVSPSLDRSLFNAADRGAGSTPARVVAMVRPRTPRRRPLETLAALAKLKGELGEGVECLSFGCTDEERGLLSGGEEVEHLGVLSREAVAGLLRRSDLFLDLSSYQAFGRTGLEAMACGCVPLLPIVGGVGEYAAMNRNALVLDVEDEELVVTEARSLLEDAERLRLLREDGLRTAETFSPIRAATSQYACFAARLAERSRG